MEKGLGHPLRDGLSSQATEPEVSALRASIPDAWQPIETAPKDGSWILAYGDNLSSGETPRIGLTRWVISKEERWERLSERQKELIEIDTSWWDYQADVAYPSHWMPLPSPPRKQG